MGSDAVGKTAKMILDMGEKIRVIEPEVNLIKVNILARGFGVAGGRQPSGILATCRVTRRT